MATTKKTAKQVTERALDERVSEIMALPQTMRLASAPTAIWVGTILSWLPDEIMIQRAEGGDWTAFCDGLECDGWSMSVALCRMVILLHEREMNEIDADAADADE